MIRHREKFSLSGWIAKTLVFIGVSALVASAAWPAQAQDWGGHRRFGGGALLQRMIQELDLTADQKQKVAGILKSHKSELLKVQEKARNAARGITQGIADENANVEATLSRMDAVTEARKEAVRVWFGIRKEILGVLTPQQKADLAKRRQRFAERIQAKIADREKQSPEERFDKWVERLTR